MTRGPSTPSIPDAGAAPGRLLDPRRGPLQAPIRGEVFGRERLAEHAASLARAQRTVPATWRSAAFFPRLRSNIAALREAQHFIGLRAAAGLDLSPGAEWLLDNFHLIESQLVEIHEGMPRSYFRTLPVLRDEPLVGLPRIYGIAWDFVTHADGAFDEDVLVEFLNAYQRVSVLGLGEVWALPTTLRAVLVENLRRLAERETAQQAARERANHCCDRIEALSPQALAAEHRRLQARGVGQAFLVQMVQRLHHRPWPTHEHVGAWLRTALPDPGAAQAQQQADQTADNLSVSNAVGALRAIAAADWADTVARCSPLIGLLLRSPLFAAEHTSTRDRALHRIEALARRTGRSELAVATTLLGLLDADGDCARASTGHWLHGAGRATLERALGLPGPWLGWGAHRRLALGLYLAAIALGTAGAVAWTLLQHGRPGPPLLMLLGAALMLLPASEAVIALIHRLVSESITPRLLPRLALARGLQPEHRVMVAVPAMLSDTATVDTLLHRLRLHHLANPEAQTQFALLSDGRDADRPQTDEDAPLLAHAAAGIRALNVAHPAAPGVAPRFILLHRERSYSPTEGCWIGWERKRGKLERLIDVLASGQGNTFIDLGEVSRIAAGTRYVLTLDSDTVLPPGRLRELVGVAAHPRNRPRLDAQARRVVEGYGILQPRLATPLPTPARVTPYHWLSAGSCGLDPYSNASSEVYQDLFGEGSFSGKGLLDVATMHAVLSRRLPPGRVLSHDLLEGALARCASVSDLPLIEELPFQAELAAARVHRWTRGDWQLLPFLLQHRRWRLGTLNCWKLADNLRRSLVAPASLLLLVLSLAGWVVAPALALLIVVVATTAGPLMGAMAGLLPHRRDLAVMHFLRRSAAELVRAVGTGLWQLTMLPIRAVGATDAIGRSLWRMTVSHRHLLQWTPAAELQAAAISGPRAALRRHALQWPLAAGLTAGWLLAHTPAPALAVGLGVLWAAAPLLRWWASRGQPPVPPLKAGQRAQLSAIARDTWRYFERCVGAEDHHLPPDNLQTRPHDALARRTSPTNIGLYLLSTACAHRFGWIERAELLSRAEATLHTLGRLQRHRGHWLNWYDTATLAPLPPLYVSTVDSGNLAGHLLAFAQACLAFASADGVDSPAASDPAGIARLQALAQACTACAWAPQWGFLYHPRRHLLHIGYRIAERQLDASLYDLLASESRLGSLLAIAKGDLPVRHWRALGRPFYAVGTTAGLRSWSGSMFEYFMPGLMLDEPHGSVLRDACEAALHEQIAFGRARGVPWGISESAYAARDHTLAYQYAPQGVPRLALRRTPLDELVIAPYATALAATIAPGRAAANFVALEALQARGRLGFIEALDFTPSRQADGDRHTPVATYMAHHQGMTIVALANVLLDGAVRRWGMADPHIEAVASLLHERPPHAVSRLRAPAPAAPRSLQAPRLPSRQQDLWPGTLAVEPTQLLSNGRYHVALRANGAGSSRWGGSGLTRWRDDALRDACGSFFYLRRTAPTTTPLVSLTQHPAPDPEARYHAAFHADRVCFDTDWPGLASKITVWVSPEDDIEFRQVELHNLGGATLEVELVSAFEPTLAERAADAAHPAFGNLFLRATWQTAQEALVLERTPRLAHERHLHAAHFIVEHGADAEASVRRLQLQVDRQRWAGRNHPAHQPLGAFDPLPAPAADAIPLVTGLDPVCALAVQMAIAPGARARLTFATTAGDDRGRLHAVIDKYRQRSHVERASLMSATLAGIRLRELRLSPEDVAAVQRLSTALEFHLARPGHPGAARCDRRALWRFGLSGERPIIGLTASAAQGLGLLRTLMRALHLWAWQGVDCDLVVIDTEPASYAMPLQNEVAAMPMPEGGSTSLHLLRADELSTTEQQTLQQLARIWLPADGRPLAHHVQAWSSAHEADFDRRYEPSSWTPALGIESVLSAPTGRFESGGAFSFDVGAGRRPQRPWINVLANPGFGTLVSESGGGHTWAVNSRMFQLTGGSNDPVADPPGECFLVQDMRSGECWSVSPSAAGAPSVVYRVTHGQGYSHIAHMHGGLEVQAEWCVDAQAPVKQLRLRLTRAGHGSASLRIVALVEWTLGAGRADRRSVHTARHRQRLPGRQLTALLATQTEQAGGFGDATAFLALAHADDAEVDWTCDRREFFDARGRLRLPERLGRTSGGSLDPCAALTVAFELAPAQTRTWVFLIGYADSPDAARQQAASAAAADAGERLQRACEDWDALLDATRVETPDPLFDALVNRWLLYQAVGCRLWARSGFYQPGGATGFRDQLQDSMALSWAAPSLLRAQIVHCASRQFVEGDVQHWWHAPGGAGVRTHFSDDRLWLPLALAHYLRATDDRDLLDEKLPFLTGPAIPEGAEDAYFVPGVSEDEASVYEHAARAIDCSLAVGAHGLPLIGTGDWNDGMNRVGHQGRGESVWLGWFLCRVVADLLPWAQSRGDAARVARWQAAAAGWRAALAGPAWDGAWFRRGFFDDGQPLGSQQQSEGRIDLIAQAWAVLSGEAMSTRQRQAMASAERLLTDPQAGLLRLLDPPFVHADPSPGYVQAYPPGVRENGGQYSHAGVWALMAQAALEREAAADRPVDGEQVYRNFRWLSPAHRSADAHQGPVYGLEPYVMAGDVYSQPPYTGRGGWSWYTGAAAWLHRAAIGSMFGLDIDAQHLRLEPCLPAHWPQASLTLRRGGRSIRLVLHRSGPGRAPLPALPVLGRGERLRWCDLTSDAAFVVPLPDAGTGPQRRRTAAPSPESTTSTRRFD